MLHGYMFCDATLDVLMIIYLFLLDTEWFEAVRPVLREMALAGLVHLDAKQEASYPTYIYFVAQSCRKECS